MAKIKITDSMQDVLVNMSEGNPGAISAMAGLMNEGERIDPQDIMVISPILWLDSLGIYGSSIYILWNDKCGRDHRKFRVLLRANQLGFVTDQMIKDMAVDGVYIANLSADEWNEIDEKVCQKLEQFEKKETTETTETPT